jgi:hypothetical protein
VASGPLEFGGCCEAFWSVPFVVTDVAIEGLEITQSIQESMAPFELRTHLERNDHQMPVPLIAGKPARLRLFPSEVQEPTPIEGVIWMKQLADARDLQDPNFPTDLGELCDPNWAGSWAGDDPNDPNTAFRWESFRALPGCTAEDRRNRTQDETRRCRSIDLKFEPGQMEEGVYVLWVGLFYDEEAVTRPFLGDAFGELSDLTDSFISENGYEPGLDPCGSPHGASLFSDPVLEDHKFVFRVNRADRIVVHGVSVCDGLTPCGDANKLDKIANLFRKLAPTHEVEAIPSTFKALGVQRTTLSDPDNPRCSNLLGTFWTDDPCDRRVVYCEGTLWLDWALCRLDQFYQRSVRSLNTADEQHYVFGIAPPWWPAANGTTGGIPSRIGVMRSPVEFMEAEFDAGVFAHEFGHMLGLRHTNQGEPRTGSRPGCLAGASSFARDPNSGWPYSDNELQSREPGSYDPNQPGKGSPEVGFDEKDNEVRRSDENFELMSYCAPVWATPWSAWGMMDALAQVPRGPDAPPPPRRSPGETARRRETLARGAALAPGTFWLVSGRIRSEGTTLDPLFTLETVGATGSGVGLHRIEILDATDSVLFARNFDPAQPVDETPGGEGPGSPFFTELVPVQAGAARIAVLGPSDTPLGSLDLGGIAPTVEITSPAGGELLDAPLTAMWNVDDPDSPEHFFWVDYSADGGTSWEALSSSLSAPSLELDPDALPGSDGLARIRVHATDGTNTGVAVSNTFSVPRKPPEATILLPEEGEVFAAGETIWLQGTGFDPEDGSLFGPALQWETFDGSPLGSGRKVLLRDLVPGPYTVILTVTDGDGNEASASVSFSVESEPLVEATSGGVPVARPGGPYSFFEGLPGEVNALASYDPDGGPLTYQWDLGDGIVVSDPIAERVYEDNGQFSLSLQVTDDEGLSNSDSTLVQVVNSAPSVTAAELYLVWAGAFDGIARLQAEFTDDGLFDNPWTVTWNFGEGSTPTVTQVNSQGLIETQHAYRLGSGRSSERSRQLPIRSER